MATSSNKPADSGEKIIEPEEVVSHERQSEV